MNLTNEEQIAKAAEKVEQLRQELVALGFEASFFYRAPSSAKAPVGYLLIGETRADLEEARADRRA